MTENTTAQTGTYNGKTAAEWRELAAQSRRESYDSFERCDTDGFVTQWASDITAREYEAKAKLAENDGWGRFVTVFDLDGNKLDATQCKTQWGYTWRIGRGDNVQWFNESSAQDPERRKKANAKKGYAIGYVEAPAYVTIGGGGSGFSGMASAHVVIRPKDSDLTEYRIVDNGQ